MSVDGWWCICASTGAGVDKKGENYTCHLMYCTYPTIMHTFLAPRQEPVEKRCHPACHKTSRPKIDNHIRALAESQPQFLPMVLDVVKRLRTLLKRTTFILHKINLLPQEQYIIKSLV